MVLNLMLLLLWVLFSLAIVGCYDLYTDICRAAVIFEKNGP